MRTTLPTDSDERKEYPLFDGCLAYFPAALAGVAKHSKAGNDRHNPGQPLHHSRGKSGDHMNCINRHQFDIADILSEMDRAAVRGLIPGAGSEPVRALLTEANALAWRALALSQELHERFANAPLAPAARLPEPTPTADRTADYGAAGVRHGDIVLID